MTERVRFFESKKYLWDGREYDDEEKAREAEQGYASDGFEVHTWRDEGKTYLYTRRVVREAVTDEG
jgi:hypothetical protein